MIQNSSPIIHRIYKYLIWIVPTILCFIKYHEIIIEPNSYLFNNTGDSLRSVYAYLYYIRHNISWLNFEGMNYPYGEHIIFTDMIAGLALPLKFLSQYLPFIQGNELLILNYSLLVSFVLQFYLLFKIGEYYGLKGHVLFWGVLSIGITSPQVGRIYAHPGLAYVFMIPTVWWFLIRYYDSGKYLNLLWLGIIISWGFFLHPYLGFISFVLAFFISLFQIFKDKNWKNFLGVFVSIAIPLVGFKLFVSYTDTHSSRPERYFDFIYYLADIKIFTAARSLPLFPFYEKINSYFPYEFEKENYFGFLPAFSILLFLLSLKYKKGTYLFKLKEKNLSLDIVYWATFLMALWAIGIPLIFFAKWINQDWYIITQFRAVGRFVWPLFFGVSIIALSFVNDGIQSSNKFRKFLSHASLYLFATEAFFIFCAFKSPQANPLNGILTNHLQKSNYTCIISLPEFCTGNGSFHKYPNPEIEKLSYQVALKTGIPLMSSVLTRTSNREAMKQMAFYTPSNFPKKILRDINISANAMVLKLNKVEWPWGNQNFHSIQLYSDSLYSVFEMPLSDCFKINDIGINGLQSNYSQSIKPAIIELFSHPLKLSFRQGNPFKLPFAHEEFQMIADNVKLEPIKEGFYEVSYKHSNDKPYQTNLVFVVEEVDHNGRNQWLASVDISAVNTVVDQFSIVKTQFSFHNSNSFVRLLLIDYSKVPVTVEISDLQIRKIEN